MYSIYIYRTMLTHVRVTIILKDLHFIQGAHGWMFNKYAFLYSFFLMNMCKVSCMNANTPMHPAIILGVRMYNQAHLKIAFKCIKQQLRSINTVIEVVHQNLTYSQQQHCSYWHLLCCCHNSKVIWSQPNQEYWDQLASQQSFQG